MTDTTPGQSTLSDSAARQLANATKTTPILSNISPRWLVHLLQWLPVEAGIYRLNKVKNPQDVLVACTSRDESELPQTFVDYEDAPREYFLNAVSTVLDVHTRVSDLYSSPHDQIKEQLRLTIETIKERQESELINNPDYGLLASVAPEQIIYPLTGAPTPDDLDELLTKVWKEPAFFLTHPLASCRAALSLSVDWPGVVSVMGAPGLKNRNKKIRRRVRLGERRLAVPCPGARLLAANSPV